MRQVCFKIIFGGLAIRIFGLKVNSSMNGVTP